MSSAPHKVAVQRATTKYVRRWLRSRCRLIKPAVLLVIVMVVWLPWSRTQDTEFRKTSDGELLLVHQSTRQRYSYGWMDNLTRYDFNFRTIVTPNVTCDFADILVMVTTAPGNFERRRAVRKTWAQDVRSVPGQILLFVVGTTSDSQLNVNLKYEMSSQNDIVQFDFVDSYNNATLKTVLSVKFAADCGPKYFVKVDDDTYVNFERLMSSVRIVSEVVDEPFIIGQVQVNAAPHRHLTKWVVSHSEYPEELFPPYVSGNLYVISGSLLRPLFNTAVYTRPLHLEDVFLTGMVATKVNTVRVHLEGIMDRERTTLLPCTYANFISSHYISAELMQKIHTTRYRYMETCWTFWSLQWCSCVPKVRAVYN